MRLASHRPLMLHRLLLPIAFAEAGAIPLRELVWFSFPTIPFSTARSEPGFGTAICADDNVEVSMPDGVGLEIPEVPIARAHRM